MAHLMGMPPSGFQELEELGICWSCKLVIKGLTPGGLTELGVGAASREGLSVGKGLVDSGFPTGNTDPTTCPGCHSWEEQSGGRYVSVP